jgi:CYTH domain-containing protein
MEVERKFLVEGEPVLEGTEQRRIEQGYLALDPQRETEVRLRREADELLLTVKGGAGRSRTEVELPLDRDSFESLWPLTEGGRLSKVRHLIPLDGLELELDVYGGSLEGLLIAEVEFPDQRAADSFRKPEWCGEEVTGDPSYLNQTLATQGLAR